jgi:cytochrome b involved in lipid metabolism
MKIIINNNIYDITTFVQEHPGGPDVFKLDENKDEIIDFTQKFNDVGHSEYAVNLLENYKVDELSEDDPRFNRSNKLEYNKTKISKLVTHEDKFHLHKILGCVSP